MPAKGWRKNKDGNLEAQALKAEEASKTLKEVTTKEVVTEIPKVKEKTEEPKALQNVSSEAKKKLPKVILSTFDKHGNLSTVEYTCSSINIEEVTNTTLSGSVGATVRRDIVRISLDADVVGIQ